VLRALALLPFLVGAAPLCGGCIYRDVEVRDDPQPVERAPYQGVHFVRAVPPPAEYRCVGRVEGVAPGGDFVAAAKDARIDIKTKAAKLGADVVKIDRMRVPSDQHPSTKPAVLLTGRAYRHVDPAERKHARIASRARRARRPTTSG
jgi:hypothetical protein